MREREGEAKDEEEVVASVSSPSAVIGAMRHESSNLTHRYVINPDSGSQFERDLEDVRVRRINMSYVRFLALAIDYDLRMN